MIYKKKYRGHDLKLFVDKNNQLFDVYINNSRDKRLFERTYGNPISIALNKILAVIDYNIDFEK